MLTKLGRELRKIRIDHSEILKDMADKLGVTASYLSAVETGKRSFPSGWENIILSSYTLDENQITELRKAILESVETVNIDVSQADFQRKEVAFTFACKVVNLPQEKLLEIKKILGGE